MSERKKLSKISLRKTGKDYLTFNDIPIKIIEKAKQLNKSSELRAFIQKYPVARSPTLTLKGLLAKIEKDEDWITEFIQKLWSLNNPYDVLNDMFPPDSLGEYILEQEPKGMGKGEIFLCWLIRNSSANGGDCSFDLKIGRSKFEVKDYRNKKNPNKPIRVGVKGKATRFIFWKQILDTIIRINKLIGITTGESKFDFYEIFDDKEFLKIVDYIIKRENAISSGEFNKTDYLNFKRFYTKVSEMNYKSKVYTNIILRGPGVKPIEFSIKPIRIKRSDLFKTNVQFLKHRESFTYVLTELRRLKYARNPNKFDADIQRAVNEIVNNIPFIIFRNERINITTDFVFHSVSQSGIVIFEKNLLKNERRI